MGRLITTAFSVVSFTKTPRRLGSIAPTLTEGEATGSAGLEMCAAGRGCSPNSLQGVFQPRCQAIGVQPLPKATAWQAIAPTSLQCWLLGRRRWAFVALGRAFAFTCALCFSLFFSQFTPGRGSRAGRFGRRRTRRCGRADWSRCGRRSAVRRRHRDRGARTLGGPTRCPFLLSQFASRKRGRIRGGTSRGGRASR